MRSELLLVGVLTVVGLATLSHNNTSQALAQANVPVEILPSNSGADAHYTYNENRVQMSLPASLADKIEAYGVGGRYWPGPRNWYGAAEVGADGSMSLTLTPNDKSVPTDAADGFPSAGPYVVYTDSGGCAGCGVESAALYFPLPKQYTSDPLFSAPPPKKGLRIIARNSRVARFSLPAVSGLPVFGVAFWSGPSDFYFSELRIVLPNTQKALTNLLEDHFASSCTAQASHPVWGC